uniref:uncharacterized protein LOC117602651 isoform X1 n=1 Tax=Osmia lignaria TaxID=473952 RepID=UPI0014794C80|nr:uncharacterized protein LOC117602651 isoform X1 [Osmia lignaria]XP_034176800.1 uncharacterized protein LOC117602651 isoform X1 [Osmia lignaria]
MKTTMMCMVTLILCHSEAVDPNADTKTRISRGQSKTFGKHPSNGLISFNSEEEKLRIDWAVTIPFISIPLDHKTGEHGEIPSLLNVNTKPLGLVGLMTTLLTVITPLFSKTHPQHNTHHHYRERSFQLSIFTNVFLIFCLMHAGSEDNVQWFQMGNIINEMIFSNNYMVPCMQQVVCSIVSLATHAENPTGTDKIIDGLSSYKWFKDFTNGTIVDEAIAVGQKGNDCARVYKDCVISPKLLKIMMNEFGIV